MLSFCNPICLFNCLRQRPAFAAKHEKKSYCVHACSANSINIFANSVAWSLLRIALMLANGKEILSQTSLASSHASYLSTLTLDPRFVKIDFIIFLKKTLAGLLGLGAILHTFVMLLNFFLLFFRCQF